jgi:hypothetical protein
MMTSLSSSIVSCKNFVGATTRANTGHRRGNDATVEEIRHRGLRAYSLEYIIPFLREHRLENRGSEPFEFLDGEQRVRLTDAGRNRCGQYGL